MRNTILITHANPQDNEFSRWLAARLSGAGYRVWVDVRALKGGEDFWDIIEQKLRHEAIKQIVIVSKSVSKPGVKKELAIGDYVSKQINDSNFMIPIRIDNIPHGEFPPELLRRNAFDAFPNWAAVLSPLLKTLSDENVPRTGGSTFEYLSDLITAQEFGRLSIQQKSETLVSNWFPILELPETINVLGSKGTYEQFEAWLLRSSAPHANYSRLAVTLCDPVFFAAQVDGGPSLEQRFWIRTDDLLKGRNINPFNSSVDARRYLVNLIRQHWNATMKRRGLRPFEYAAGDIGWFFPDGLVEGRYKRDLPNGLRVDRALSGKFKDRRWHLCLVAKPRLWPEPLIRIHANIALTENGRDPLPGDQTQRIRRRLTKSWWNDKWRDLLLAGIGWLSEGREKLSLATGAEVFSLSSMPMEFDFPVSYTATEERSSEEDESGEVRLDEELGGEMDVEIGDFDADGAVDA